jgi:hypothetical protein
VDRGRAIAAELLLALTNDAAVIVRRVTAFPDRLEFWLLIRLAERTGGMDDAQLRVELPDGRTQMLRRLRAGAEAEHYHGEFAVEEPVEGVVTFVLDWPSRGIADARTSLAVAST